MPLTDDQVDHYLARIGATRPQRPDPDTLRELHLRHLRTVPFENLSIHLGEPIVLSTDALLAKIVGARRGGFCYELNGLFGALLESLGYAVTRFAARVHGPDGYGPLFDHLALGVTVPGAPAEQVWLADVGFGRHSEHPLRLDLRTDQDDPGGVFRIEETADGDLAVLRDGAPQYLLEQRPRTLADFEPTCWWQQTSPTSHFTASLVCSRATEAGRVTLSDRTLVVTDADGRHERELPREELPEAYRTHFGMVLDRIPDPPDRPGVSTQ